MWISDWKGELVNLDYACGIAIERSGDKCCITSLIPSLVEFDGANNGIITLCVYDTEEQAKSRINQIRQELRNHGHFINLD